MGSTRKSAPAAKKAPQRRTKTSQAAVAQSAERRASAPEAAGSTPAGRSTDLLQRLNAKQRAFAIEYLKDGNATQAYRRAGYRATEDAARTNAARLLANAHVASAVQALTDERDAAAQAETGITLERVLRELGRLAFFDPRRLFDSLGNPISITDLDDDTAAAIQGLDVLEEWDGTGKDRVFVGLVKKWKLSDKKPALDMLMKHLGGFEKDRRAGVDTLAALLGTIQRSALPIAKQVDDGDAA